ncbi:MAG: TonB-dependent receptor [Ignavibacteria bacterium]|jgi:outer membrane receptor protein involved in Fe transport
MKKNIFMVLKMTAYYSAIGVILQCFLVSILFASSSAEGQELKDTKLTLTINNITFEEVLHKIEKTTNFKFFYLKEDVPLNKIITIDVTNESLYDLLEGLAGQYNLVFQRINNQIVIKKANFEEYEEPVIIQQTGSIRGKVTDAKTGEALMGANIMLKETSTGVAANENGEYSLEKLSPGNYTLVIKYIGYSTKEETVEVVENRTVELNIELDPTAFDLNEVIVTGSIVETKKKTLGTSITIIKPKELEQMNTSSVTELFEDQQIAGVTSMDLGTNSDMGQRIYIRGSNTGLTGFISPTKLLVDGVEVETRVMSTISAEDIERIEIIRGPQASTLYGSEAAGGVIQIFTKKGSSGQPLQGSISTNQGVVESKYDPSSFWKRSYNGSLNGGFIGGSFGLGASYTQSEGFAENLDRQDANISFGFQKNLLDNLNISIISRYGHRRFGYPGSAVLLFDNYQDGKLPSSKSYIPDPNDYYTFEKIALGINASYVYNNWWEHQLTIGYYKLRAEQRKLPSYLYAADTTLTRYTNDWIRKTYRYSTNIKLPQMGILESSVTAGLEYVEPEYLSVSNTYENTGEPYVRSILSGYIWEENSIKRAFFGQAKLGFDDKLFITAGVRTDYNSNNGPNYSSYSTNPRFGFSYLIEPTEGWVIKTRGSWGIGIQSPTLIMRNGGLPYTLPNSDIGPQTTTGWELGADQYFLDGALYFEFTYYYQYTEDQISIHYPDMENNPRQYQYANMGEVENSGAELIVKYTYESMDLSANVAYNHNEIKELATLRTPVDLVGKPIAASTLPQVTAGFSFNYRLNELLNIGKEHRTSVGFNINYLGKRWAIDNYSYMADASSGSLQSKVDYLKWFDGFVKVNLFGNYNITKNLGVGLKIRNLFNCYEQPTPGFYVTGRETLFSLKMNF